MYKNFSISEEEKKQILESHISHGYRKPLNELGDREIDLVRGKPDFKTQSGKPVGDYVSRRNASRQFQQDFQRDFTDPGDEYTPHWEKDRPNSDGESELELDIRTSARQADREFGTKKVELDSSKQQHKEELKQLGRRISSIMSHKTEFGGDELDDVLEKLKAQYRELDNKYN
jgi:hypothetical protein